MQIVFAQRPKVESVGHGLSRTLEETEIRWMDRGNHYRLIIPAGFLFDGASIPRPFWTLLGLAPHGDMDGPALPHDFIYHHQGDLPLGSFLIRWPSGRWKEVSRPFGRDEADALLQALCLYFKVSKRLNSTRAWLVWSAVRTFGWLAWKRDDDARKSALFNLSAGECA